MSVNIQLNKRQNVFFKKGVMKMIITKEIAEKVRIKRGKYSLTKIKVADILNISRSTLNKIEAGDYDAPKRIFQSVMNWLVEDL